MGRRGRGDCGRCVTWTSLANLSQFLSVSALERCYRFVILRAELWICDSNLWRSCGGYFWIPMMITIGGRSFKSLQGRDTHRKFIGQLFSVMLHSNALIIYNVIISLPGNHFFISCWRYWRYLMLTILQSGLVSHLVFHSRTPGIASGQTGLVLSTTNGSGH